MAFGNLEEPNIFRGFAENTERIVSIDCEKSRENLEFR